MAYSKEAEKIMVAAIDFGTTYSGYAFAFRHDYESDPLKITGNQWLTGSQAGVSLKTPSCVLFNPRGHFHSFGYEAEEEYVNLAYEEKHSDWYFFRRFKMKLYNNPQMGREDLLEDEEGNTMPAMTVFSAIINYLRGHLLDACKSRDFGLSESEIKWVLTVPAIWSDGAKQFMREAAEQGGIPSSQLLIALEPEVASIYCKNVPMNKREDSSTFECFDVGTKYLILDAGGGTIDITVQEVQGDCSLTEVYKANGGDWGGTKVDEAFEDFLGEVFTPDVLYRFKREKRGDYLELCREFEIKKRTITPELDHQKVTFKIPISLNDVYQDIKRTSLRDSITAAGKYKGQLALIGDKMRVDAEIARGFFTTTCDVITEHMSVILREPEVEGTSTILMVGGFSESAMLRHAVQKKFAGMRIIMPYEAGLSVLKGAVQYGFNPQIITTRVCKFTYGIETLNDFDDQVHPQSKKIFISGECYCNDCFSKHVEIGQSVKVGEATEERTYFPITEDQRSMRLAVYVSEDANPQYTTDSSCTYLGELTVDLPDEVEKNKRNVGVKLIFGGTELSVEARVIKTGEVTKAAFNFLNRGGSPHCEQQHKH
ncbi:hypothetical protein KUTeg_024971 [Tegillarca granosa]|uniref:Uncharacterized protein n=1 Tax=Tegillarca granosa TaxID=220873 RepID=A0ABQ9E4H6_TEGGR|nr:hypothetical protein KUTeg_024971 [Tegillarca granosa]